jgi:hypothetical protein
VARGRPGGGADGRFGLEWTARDDGHGFEIKGVSGEMMRLFSSRRESITKDLRARAARFEQRYDRVPSQRELGRTLRAAELAGLDAGQALAAAAGERDLTGARGTFLLFRRVQRAFVLRGPLRVPFLITE